MKKKFDAIIIGTGQSGPSLANRLTKNGMKVAIIERKRFGGTCVNNGCTPTKALVANAKVAHMVRTASEFGVNVDRFTIDMKKVKSRKDSLVKQSSQGVESWLKSMEHCTVFEGHGSFEDPHIVRVNDQLLQGEKIFIDVGGRAKIPEMSGLDRIHFLTNTSILELDVVPEHLLIVGGGYIALEFGQIFRRLGSKVTIFQRQPYLMPKEDTDISETIRQILEKEGIQIITNASNLSISAESRDGKIQFGDITGTHLLLATGRVPNTHDLGLEKAGVEKDQKGFIKVNDQLQTSQSHIWALGDCNGRGAFTHTSYNDYEIVAQNLLENEKRRVTDRIPVYALFTDPPLGRVGMSEEEVKKNYPNAMIAKLPMTKVARAREKGETEGFMKILVEADSKQILGAAFLGTGCDEVIQLISNMMYAKAPYTVIQNGVGIHPTVSELLPTLLSELKPLEKAVSVELKI